MVVIWALCNSVALAELIEDSFASGNEAFRFCVEYFCPGGKESVLEGLLTQGTHSRKLFRTSGNHPPQMLRQIPGIRAAGEASGGEVRQTSLKEG